MMLKKIDIVILSILSILYIIINDYQLYFLLIYIFLSLYYIYYIYKYIRIGFKNNLKAIIKFIIFSLFHFIVSYFLICDPNPFYYIFTFYLPFPNLFKAIFICLFHSYQISKFKIKNTGSDNSLIISSNFNETSQLINPENSNKYKLEHFLSGIFNYLKNYRIMLLGLIILKIIIYYYNSKFWIYIFSKKTILPLSTSNNFKFYITACIYNIEPIIVDYINEMKKLIEYLGEKNIIVSIVENGDSNDNTREYLSEYKKYLDSKLITNKFILSHEIDDPRKKSNLSKDIVKHKRIEFLSYLRNKCFELLYQIPNLDFNKIKVINFNDVVFNYEDVIKLLSTNKEDYDVVCAMDFYFNFYDSWVSIDLDGENILGSFPYFKNKEGQEQYINQKPIRIFSCWNGIIAFNASSFANKKIKFRYESIKNENKISLCNLPRIHKDDSYESECTYFNIDLETLGFKKRFINPNVRVAYNYKYYYFAKYILPNSFEIIFYFVNYFKSFFRKRNKYKKKKKSYNITYPTLLNNWYKCNIFDE